MGLWPTADLTAFSQASGVSAVTAAFVVADRSSACSPTWAGYTAYTIGGAQDFQSNIAAFQSAGGRVVASFGGAVNDELARVCIDPAKVLAAYTKVVTRFGLDRVDFDIEGADVSDAAANQRRATAVAALQKQRAAAGHPLQVTLTLPVMPYGLLDSGLRTIREFAAAGVQLSAVNLMTMDYGTGVTDMAKAAIDAATATAAQLKTVSAYAALSDAQRRALVAVTPMIGVNDTGEVFTLANATTVAAYAKANGLAGLGWWELTRDQPCTGGIPAYMCTGMSSTRWAYSKAFVAAAR
nr:chitinase [Leifsonia aquatica]